MTGYQRSLLQNGMNQEGQAPQNAGVVSVPGPERATRAPADADPLSGAGVAEAVLAAHQRV